MYKNAWRRDVDDDKLIEKKKLRDFLFFFGHGIVIAMRSLAS